VSKPATGELVKLRAGGFAARVRIEGTRKEFHLPFCATEAEARERCTALATMAWQLRKAGHGGALPGLLAMGANAPTAERWQAVLAAAGQLLGGRVVRLSAASQVTVAEFGKQWRSGELHKLYPDHVKDKDSDRDGQLARLFVDPIIGTVPVSGLTLEHCDRVMAAIPEGKASGTRRHVAQYLRRLVNLAVYPGKLRQDNPVPKGWLPRIKDAKAKECLYPSEDRALMACTAVPLARRLAYGFLAREGMRTDELARLAFRDLDLENGRVSLDENKTDDPRQWLLDPGVHAALLVWQKRFCEGNDPNDKVFSAVNVEKLAARLRTDLQRAGVTREKLFERSATRQPIRAHDLRATFTTCALANGKTETWVADRTGHKSSTMIARYRRKARAWDMGPLAPLNEAIPELATEGDCPILSGNASGVESASAASCSEVPSIVLELVAGAGGLEPTTCGFGIRCSTN
jgi:integrase